MLTDFFFLGGEGGPLTSILSVRTLGPGDCHKNVPDIFASQCWLTSDGEGNISLTLFLGEGGRGSTHNPTFTRKRWHNREIVLRVRVRVVRAKVCESKFPRAYACVQIPSPAAPAAPAAAAVHFVG